MPDITRGAPELARLIDHTLLKPDAQAGSYETLCREAMEFDFYAVCIPPAMVNFCRKILRPSNVKVCSVVGFPFGYNLTATKAFESKMAVEQGAHEIDMVLNLAQIKARESSRIVEDIRSVVRAASGHVVKVIIETCYLTDEEKRFATDLIVRAGAHFVKTSTGFGAGGATEADVALLSKEAGGRIGIKASGGIRDRETAKRMLSLGATRLGTSQSVAIVSDVKGDAEARY